MATSTASSLSLVSREGLVHVFGGSGQKRVPVSYLAVLWYTSAAVAVTSSRGILRVTHLPFCLSACQFVISTGFTYTLLRWVLPWWTKGSFRVNLRDLPRESPERYIVHSIALTYTLGFLFTNVALSLCNASFAETVKAAEPISSLALAQLSRGEDAVSRIEWLTTLPIVAGVGLSSYSETSFHVLGFLAAGTSNFMFSLRALHAKQLRRNHGSPVGLDDLHLFFRISRFGSKLLVPIALLFEGRALFRLLFSTPVAMATSPTVGGLLANSTEPVPGGLESPALELGAAPTLSLSQILLLVLLNGICYCTYNQTSFVVLGRVPFVTHATLNVMRRVFIIIVTSWYFQTAINGLNMFGIALAISGFSLFLYMKVYLSSLPTLPR